MGPIGHIAAIIVQMEARNNKLDSLEKIDVVLTRPSSQPQ